MLLVSVLFCAKASAATTPVAIVDMIDYDSLINSRVYFQDMSLKDQCHKDNSCPYTTYTRYVPTTLTENVSDELEQAWKDFQENAYWHMNARLNISYPIGVTGAIPNCVTGLGGNGVKRTDTPLDISVPDEGLYKNNPLNKPLIDTAPINQWDGVELKIPSEGGILWPSTKTSGFCMGITPQWFPPDNMYPILPQSAYMTARQFNGINIVGTAFPKPAKINWPIIRQRLQQGCNTVRNNLYKDYLRRVATAQAKLSLTAVVWGKTPAVVPGEKGPILTQAVYEEDATRIAKIPAKVAKLFTKAHDPREPVYLGVAHVGGVTESAADRPGIKELEDVKRFMPVTSLKTQVYNGTANLYQMWTSMDIVVDPRPLILMTYASSCHAIAAPPFVACVPVPFPLPVSNTFLTAGNCTVTSGQGTGNITYTLPRVHYRYVGVPEGGAVPGLHPDDNPLPMR